MRCLVEKQTLEAAAEAEAEARRGEGRRGIFLDGHNGYDCTELCFCSLILLNALILVNVVLASIGLISSIIIIALILVNVVMVSII